MTTCLADYATGVAQYLSYLASAVVKYCAIAPQQGVNFRQTKAVYKVPEMV